MGGSPAPDGDMTPSFASRLLRRLLVWFYYRQGWSAVGDVPAPRRFVIIAAPHTSNWDFLYFLGLTDALAVKAHFMAKQSLFRWPLRGFMLQMGGIPVDRQSRHNYVAQMVGEFARREQFVLTVAPEGTRGKVRQWRTGFYQIALAANVPIVCGLMDYARKTGGLGPAIMPSGDYEADMKLISAYYHSVSPKYPDRALTDIVAQSAAPAIPVLPPMLPTTETTPA